MSLGLVDQLVPKDHDQVKRDSQITSDEALVVERAVTALGKRREVLGECNDDTPE